MLFLQGVGRGAIEGARDIKLQKTTNYYCNIARWILLLGVFGADSAPRHSFIPEGANGLGYAQRNCHL